MEALQVLKLSAHNSTLNLTEHLSDWFDPLEDILEVSEVLGVACGVETESFG